MPAVECRLGGICVWLRIDRRAPRRASCGLPSSASLLSGLRRVRAPFGRSCGSDRDCMARVMYFESIRSSDEGMLAVGTVVMNRVESNKYPNSVCAVVGQPNQFAPGALSRSMPAGKEPRPRLSHRRRGAGRQAPSRRRQGDVLPHRRAHLRLFEHALRRGRRRQRLLRAQADAGSRLYPAQRDRAGRSARFRNRAALVPRQRLSHRQERASAGAAAPTYVAAASSPQPRPAYVEPAQPAAPASIEAIILASNGLLEPHPEERSVSELLGEDALVPRMVVVEHDERGDAAVFLDRDLAHALELHMVGDRVDRALVGLEHRDLHLGMVR